MNTHRHCTYTDVPSLFACALSGWVSSFLAKKLFTSAPDASQEIDVLLLWLYLSYYSHLHIQPG